MSKLYLLCLIMVEFTKELFSGFGIKHQIRLTMILKFPLNCVYQILLTKVVAEEVGCYKLHIPSNIVDSDHLLMMV